MYRGATASDGDGGKQVVVAEQARRLLLTMTPAHATTPIMVQFPQTYVCQQYDKTYKRVGCDSLT